MFARRQVLLWNFATREIEHVDLAIKDPTFMRWSRAAGSNQLAIGTGRGELLLYDRAQRTCWSASARHKKRITCGDWNGANQFAFASDDRQITICSADGKTFGQVKVKSRPTNVKFGAVGGGGGGGAAGTLSGSEGDRHNIVSVSMVGGRAEGGGKPCVMAWTRGARLGSPVVVAFVAPPPRRIAKPSSSTTSTTRKYGHTRT